MLVPKILDSVPKFNYSTMSKIYHKVHLDITEKEQSIINILLDAANALQKEKPNMSQLTLRIAGGWVRDKLMLKDSHDIDLALDNIKGYDFACFVNEYLRSNNMPVKRIGLIQLNSEKSKHLETATCDILGHEIDFVNLRAEDYSDDSRIPTIRFGTPKEDAERRDITINALFYNLHTREVEDFTEKGMADLQNHLVRTPLEPQRTFLDDPLRVLRCIRFATRFQYTVHKPLIEAAKNLKVQNAFIQKISKERVGVEISKSIKTSPNHLSVLSYLIEWEYYDHIFNVDDIWGPLFPNKPEQLGMLRFLQDIQKHSPSVMVAEYASKYGFPLPNEKMLRIFATSQWLLALAAKIHSSRDSLTQHEWLEKLSHSLRNGLKWPTDEIRTIAKFVYDCGLVSDTVMNESFGAERSVYGFMVEDWSSRPVGDYYYISYIFAMYFTVFQSNSMEYSAVARKFNAFFSFLAQQELHHIYKTKPLLDGNQIISALNINKGRHMTKILQDMRRWQLNNPTGTAKECSLYLQSRKSSYINSI